MILQLNPGNVLSPERYTALYVSRSYPVNSRRDEH